MPKFSKGTASDVRQMGPVTDRREQMDGYTVEFVSFEADADLDGPLQTLPGEACQCPHWGYVIAGRMRFVFGDREEVYEAGDAFYTPPGHRPYVDAGTEVLQFSPTQDLRFSNARSPSGWLSREPPPRNAEGAGGSYAPPAGAAQQQSVPPQQPSQQSLRICALLSSMEIDTLY